jgi:hypothetical protein
MAEAVDASELKSFTNALKGIEKDIGKALTKELRKVGDEARDVIRSSSAPPHDTGTLRRSIKTSVRSGVVSLTSSLPQAPVHEYGGKISPRGVSIKIKETHFVAGTVLALGDQIDTQMSKAVEKVAQHHGF